MLEIVAANGGHIINADRMWHYPEGIQNYAPIWTRHGIRILSGPSPLWLDANGKRLPVPLFPGFDCYGALEHVIFELRMMTPAAVTVMQPWMSLPSITVFGVEMFRSPLTAASDTPAGTPVQDASG
jgi:hypothetical protein